MSKLKETEPNCMASGGRVSWHFYRTKVAAIAAGERAKRAAERRRAKGYDFGFCSPGSVEFLDPKDHPTSIYRGLYRVCVP